jgi:hypothetical protein
MKREQYRQLASEHSLQASLLEHLRFNAKPDVYWFAIPNAGRRSWQAGARMKAEGLTRGVADLCIMLPRGRTGWLEMKTAKGRQTDEQMGFQARCERMEHHYAVARNLEEAVDILKRWEALK